jgi:circadian clock protein KaiB
LLEIARITHPFIGPAVSDLRLKLFVAGDSPRAREAAANLARACAELATDAITVETVDVLQYPEEADAYRILTTPTVVREHPLPRRRATGDLGDAARLLAALALSPAHQTP